MKSDNLNWMKEMFKVQNFKFYEAKFNKFKYYRNITY